MAKAKNMKIISVHQPGYFPWLVYFHKIAVADTFVILDTVPFEKNGFINRNQIKTSQGWAWLTVPVLTKGKFGGLICNTEVNNNVNWKKKHRESIFQNYSKAAYFEPHTVFLEELYTREWRRLSELNIWLIRYIAKELGINTKIITASQELANVEGKKGELVFNICRALGADIYFSGKMGSDYLDTSLFAESGIRVCFQDYVHPEYKQLNRSFIPNLSIVDLLFNCGDGSLEKLMEGNITKDTLQSRCTLKGDR
jgi:hypothetical protein